MKSATPATDNYIRHKYASKTLDRKVKNKVELQRELDWPEEPRRAIICLPAGMTDELGGELFENILEGLFSLPVEILILGKGSEKYGKLFTRLTNDMKHRIAIIPNETQNIRMMYAASDMALFLSDALSLPELRECLSYGVVPIAPAHASLERVDPIQESGIAFTYDETNVWHVFASVVRALESQQFPFDWRTIQRHCMESVG